MFVNIIAQVIAAMAIIFMVASYFSMTKKQYLLLHIFCEACYGLQFYLIGGLSAASTGLVNVFKIILFYFYTKRFGKIPLWLLLIFEAITIAFGFFTVRDFLSAMPIIIACIHTYGTWQKNLKITYLLGSFVGISWLIYSGCTGAYVAMIGSGLEVIASLVGQYRLGKIKSSNKAS